MSSIRAFFILSFSLLCAQLSNAQVFRDEASFRMIPSAYVSQTYNYQLTTIHDATYKASDSSANYVAKFRKTTTKNIGQEGEESTIEVFIYPKNDFLNPKYLFSRDCDEIQLSPKYYTSIKDFCCNLPSLSKLYNYSNELILGSTSEIYEVRVPNTEIVVLIGYETSDKADNLGYINISTNYQAVRRFELKGKGTKNPGCPFLIPKYRFNIDKKKDTINKRTITLNAQNGIESIQDLNFSFSVEIKCVTKQKPFTINFIKGIPKLVN